MKHHLKKDHGLHHEWSGAQILMNIDIDDAMSKTVVSDAMTQQSWLQTAQHMKASCRKGRVEGEGKEKRKGKERVEESRKLSPLPVALSQDWLPF